MTTDELTVSELLAIKEVLKIASGSRKTDLSWLIHRISEVIEGRRMDETLESIRTPFSQEI